MSDQSGSPGFETDHWSLPDNMGRASLTWTDYDGNNRRNIFYALVGSAGEVVTPAAILLTGQGSAPHIRVLMIWVTGQLCTAGLLLIRMQP